METFELIEKLAEKPEIEIRYALTALMLKGSIEFNTLNSAYVDFLEKIRKDQRDRLSEVNCAVLDLMVYCAGKETKSNHAAIHRALHNLNESRQFNMQTLNEKYGYDEEKDKELSWYWREHNSSFARDKR